MDEREGGRERLVGQVMVEGGDLLRHQQALKDHSACGEAADVEEVAFRQLLGRDRPLDELADYVELQLESERVF